MASSSTADETSSSVEGGRSFVPIEEVEKKSFLLFSTDLVERSPLRMSKRGAGKLGSDVRMSWEIGR